MEDDSHEVDYENALGEEHDGQYEYTVSAEQDADYVNTERINSHDQYDDTDSEYPAGHHVEREMQGNGMFYHKYCIRSDHIFYCTSFYSEALLSDTNLYRDYIQNTICIIVMC